MDIINKLIGFVVNIISSILPSLGVPDSFFSAVDSAFSMFLTFTRSASFFVPLDIMIVCLTVMLIVDNFALLSRIVQWVIGIVRG